MMYRDRKLLSILTLTEDQGYVTYDELIRVLEERPSNAVYIERDGILCGLITSGRIGRSHDEKNRRVPFNKKYTYVHPEEYLRVRQIFKDKEKINVLPVISENGRLLGDYVRWDDLICRDYAKILCKDPYILQGLKKHIQEAVFIAPDVHGGGANKAKMFLWWRQELESKGIHLQVIRHWEIKDHFNDVKYFLFIDEDEGHAVHILNQVLYQHQREVPRCETMTDCLYRMRRRATACLNESFLKELQNKGVFVLVFGFKENSNQFLAALDERIRKHNEEYGVNSSKLPNELKESFFDELYCEAYKTQEFPISRSMSVQTRFGIPYFRDIETEFIHIKNGERLTANQPEQYDRCIYLYGPCVVTGCYVSDQYTISSLLQSELNQAGFSCKVANRGFMDECLTTERLQSGSFQQGDIVVLDQHRAQVENFPILNLTDALEKHDAPVDWFCNGIRHCNHKANQVFAHAIYEELLPVLQQPPKEKTTVELDFDYIDCFYLRHYFSEFDPVGHGVIGSIVMNCNPFTFGHRFLIEEALKTVDFLIIFVVEEDESLFSFQERFAMVCQGTSDLKRVMVVPSGPYILSKNIFPEYFEKIDDEDLKKNTEDDITLFAEKIAPRLGITYRFVGEEREDKVTNEYNEAMKRILPHYGIQLVEIPRKANGQSVISASWVRQCLEVNQMEELDELIPASTKRILFFEDE